MSIQQKKKKNSDQNYETILILSLCKLCIFVCLFIYVFVEPIVWGPERKSLWSKYIGEICVMVVYIKIIFHRLILN